MIYIFTNFVCKNLWHAQWDLFASHLFLHPRNLKVSNLPRSMASKKSQMSKNATNSVGWSTSSNASTSPITQNKAKAKGFFTEKEVIGKAPVTNLTNAPP